MAEPDQLQPHGKENERLPGDAPNDALRNDQLERAHSEHGAHAGERGLQAVSQAAAPTARTRWKTASLSWCECASQLKKDGLDVTGF